MGAFGIVRQRRAFTLVEVLAALAFTAIVLPVAMKGISLATTAASEARRRSEATVLAQNMIAELTTAGVPQFSETSGDFTPDNPEYRWTAEFSDWQEANLKQLQVQVIWKTRGSERSVALTTLIYAEGS